MIGQQENGLEREFARTKVEQVLERRAEKVHDEHVVIALSTAPFDQRNADAALHHAVDLRFDVQLGMFRSNAFEFNRHFFIGGDIRT